MEKELQKKDGDDHWIALSEEWGFWHYFIIRGTGFPISRVLALAAKESAKVADQLLENERRVESAYAKTIDFIRKENGDAEGIRLSRLEQLSRSGPHFEKSSLHLEGQAQLAFESWRAARKQLETTRQAFQSQFNADRIEIRRTIREIARDGYFREAVLWQNPDAVHNALDGLLRMPSEAGSSEACRRERLIATYLQRYCAKNDTIGFFGPVGWGRLTSNGRLIEVRPGRTLLDKRTVYFEGWAIDVLAEKLWRQKELRPWFPALPVSTLSLEGTTLHGLADSPVQLTQEQARVFGACDGERTPREIAGELSRDPGPAVNEADVCQILGEFRARGIIAWPDIPMGFYPEQALRNILNRVEDGRLRAAALAQLSEMETARDEVARSAGDSESLARALANLDRIFVDLTGQAPMRRPGTLSAGRRLVYEECRRNIAVEMGPEFLARLWPPLRLLLTSGRWYSYEVARRSHDVCKQVYADSVREIGSREISALYFIKKVMPLIIGAPESAQGRGVLNEVGKSFLERWSDLLGALPADNRISFSSAKLWLGVKQAFDAPCPGFPRARDHNVTFLIAAQNADSIRQGDYKVVLHSHRTNNRFPAGVFSSQHPAPEEILRALEEESPDYMLLRAPYKSGTEGLKLPATTFRLKPTIWRQRDYAVHLGTGRLPGPKRLPIADLVVTDSETGLIVRTRSGQLRYDLVSFLGNVFLTEKQPSKIPQIIPEGRHTARIEIDDLIVAREKWRFTESELDIAKAGENDADRFAKARRWARDHGLPRYVFLAVSAESMKSVYIDFDSPIFVDIFLRLVRRTLEQKDRAPVVEVEEMLPTHGQTWLVDADGKEYPSEIRMWAVDRSYPPRAKSDGH